MTALGSLCQCFTTLKVKNFLLASNLNPPSSSLKPLPLVLSLLITCLSESCDVSLFSERSRIFFNVIFFGCLLLLHSWLRFRKVLAFRTSRQHLKCHWNDSQGFKLWLFSRSLSEVLERSVRNLMLNYKYNFKNYFFHENTSCWGSLFYLGNAVLLLQIYWLKNIGDSWKVFNFKMLPDEL